MREQLGAILGSLLLFFSSSTSNYKLIQKATGGVGYGKGNHLEFTIIKTSFIQGGESHWEVKGQINNKEGKKVFQGRPVCAEFSDTESVFLAKPEGKKVKGEDFLWVRVYDGGTSGKKGDKIWLAKIKSEEKCTNLWVIPTGVSEQLVISGNLTVHKENGEILPTPPPTSTPTSTSTPTITPTNTPTPTTEEPTSTPTSTPTDTPTNTPTPTETPIPTETPTPTSTPEPTVTPTLEAGSTPTPTPSEGWYNTSFAFRKKITIDHDKVPDSLKDFPVYIDLSDLGDHFFTNVKSDGSDIVITRADGTTKLSRELVSIDISEKTGELYFKGDLNHDADTVFYIYYGNSSGAETNDQATWGDNYSHVYHLETLKDSKGSINITNNGCSQQDVKIGKGYAVIANTGQDLTWESNIVMKDTFSLSWWMQKTDKEPLNRYAFGNVNGQAAFYIAPYSGNLLQVFPDNYSGNVREFHNATNFDNLDRWVLTNNSTTNLILYKNGSQLESLDAYANTLTCTCNNIAGTYPGSSFVGTFDEIRFSTVELSPEWITAEYNNQNSPSTFYTVGGLEEVYVPLGFFNKLFASLSNFFFGKI